MSWTRNVVLALAAVAFAGAAAAQEIKISHQWKANADGRDRAARVFVEEVNKRDPSLKFRIYPAGSLNIKPVAQLDALQAGTLEMTIYPISYAVGKTPEFSICIMPGTISSLEHAMKLKGTRFHEKLQQIAEENGIRIITWWWTPGGFGTKDRAGGGPDTVEGLSLRAAASNGPSFSARLGISNPNICRSIYETPRKGTYYLPCETPPSLPLKLP